jgi:hypothetical protein
MNANLLTPAPPAALPRLVLTLTHAQRQNLLGFLQRASLSGREVSAFNEVFTLIQRATPAEKSETEPET